jgi:hypothetical protein
MRSRNDRLDFWRLKRRDYGNEEHHDDAEDGTVLYPVSANGSKKK